jgi:hypothetical protein
MVSSVSRWRRSWSVAEMVRPLAAIEIDSVMRSRSMQALSSDRILNVLLQLLPLWYISRYGVACLIHRFIAWCLYNLFASTEKWWIVSKCIAEEADFMSRLLTCKIKNDVEEDVFITEVLDDDSLNFSNNVRQVAFDILTTYSGPCSSQCIAATMLVWFDLSTRKVLFTQFEVLICALMPIRV